jgi:hypothetical protein
MLSEIGGGGHEICPKIAVRAVLEEKGIVGIVSVKIAEPNDVRMPSWMCVHSSHQPRLGSGTAGRLGDCL